METSTMDESKVRALAEEIAKGIKTESDLNELTRALRKNFIETALNAELDEHLGYDKHDPAGRGSGNSRNGKGRKRLKGDHGEVEIETPRDRNGTFEPQLVAKGQTRLTELDDKILFLYAQGLSTREIVAAFKELYDAEVSSSLISRVTDRVIEQVTAWQSRPLDAIYPIVYLDCIVLKVRHNQRVINQSIDVSGPRRQSGRPKGTARLMACSN